MTSTLKDQIGVMAIIDQVRHQQSAQDEYLSLNAQKETVRQRVTDYYASQGISVPDSVIDEGIKKWFSDRFKAPKYDNNALVNAYLALPRVKPHITKLFQAATSATAVMSFCAVLVIWFLVDNFQGYQYRSWLNNHYAQVQESQELSAWFQGHLPRTPLVRNAAIDSLTSEHFFLLMKSRLDAESIKKTASSVEKELLSEGSDGDYQSPILKFHKSIEELKQAKIRLEKASQDLNSIEATAKSFYQFESINRSLIAEQPMVANAAEELRSLLNTPGSKWAVISKAETVLKERSMLAGTVKQRLAALDAKRTHLLSFNLPQSDVDLVEQLYESYSTSIKTLDITETNAIKHFDFLAQIVGSRLELRVNPDGIGKTGVERTFEGSGGKSWYIIASAVTTGSDTVDMFLKNRETGQFSLSTKFGVKVTQDKFKAVGLDKKDDGVVSDSLLAVKPLGSLHFQPETDVEIDFITQW